MSMTGTAAAGLDGAHAWSYHTDQWRGNENALPLRNLQYIQNYSHWPTLILKCTVKRLSTSTGALEPIHKYYPQHSKVENTQMFI